MKSKTEKMFSDRMKKRQRRRYRVYFNFSEINKTFKLHPKSNQYSPNSVNLSNRFSRVQISQTGFGSTNIVKYHYSSFIFALLRQLDNILPPSHKMCCLGLGIAIAPLLWPVVRERMPCK